MRLPCRLLTILPVTMAMAAGAGLASCAHKQGGDEGGRTVVSADLPQPVKATFDRETAGGKVMKMKQIKEDGKILYVAEMMRDGKETEVEVFADGQICCIETKVKLVDLPAAVRAAVERETAGMKIEKIEEKVSKGKKTYTVEAEIGGKELDLELAEDGSVISRETEGE